jgi:hypothetical protein
MPGLPGGRGQRAAGDSFVNQNEAFDERKQRIPSIRGGFMGATKSPFFISRPGSTNGWSLTRTYFVPLVDPAQDVVLDEARLGVETLAATSLCDVALYRQDRSEPNKILRIPQSEVQFDCTAAGLKTVKTTRIVLKGGLMYFLGWGFQAAVATVTAANIQTAAGTLVPPIRIKYEARVAGGSLPNNTLLDGLTDDTSISHIPAVMYLSKEYAEFF